MSEQPPKRRIHPLSIWIPVIIAALGLVVFESYLLRLKQESMANHGESRLPMLSKLEKNLVLTERNGKTVELKNVQGKVLVACWVYTHCPRGCPGVVGELLKLYKDVGSDPGIHFLSFSVDPTDTPAVMQDFTSRFGIKGDNWWFVNGPMDEVRHYMTKYFGFMAVQDVAEKDRLSPDDKFLHDMKVALVDKQGNVRGMYDIGSADPEFAKFFRDKIRKDIQTLLKEPAAAQP